MSKTNRILFIIFIVVLLIAVINIINSKKKEITVNNQNQPKRTQGQFNAQESNQNNVIVTVEPQVLEVGKNPKFKLEFSTHSVNLNFDLSQISLLTDDKGNIYNNPVWEGSPPGGHHRSGTLSFSKPLTNTKYVELIIKDVAVVSERKFRWSI